MGEKRFEKGATFRQTVPENVRREIDKIADLIPNKHIILTDEQESEFSLFDYKGNLTDQGFEYLYDLWISNRRDSGYEDLKEAMDELGVETGDHIFPSPAK